MSTKLQQQQDLMKQRMRDLKKGIVKERKFSTGRPKGSKDKVQRKVHKKVGKKPLSVYKPLFKPNSEAEKSLGDLEAERLQRLRRRIKKSTLDKYNLGKFERQKLQEKLFEAQNGLYNFLHQVSLLESLLEGTRNRSSDANLSLSLTSFDP